LDVTAIRTDIANALEPAYPYSLGYVPEDVVLLPAAIVNPPRTVNYALSLGLAELEFVVTIAVPATQYQQAQRLLDAAMGVGVTGSVWDALNVLTDPASPSFSSNLRSLKVMGAENLRVVKEGKTSAIALDIVVEVTARTR
jgi:hypothetical protein